MKTARWAPAAPEQPQSTATTLPQPPLPLLPLQPPQVPLPQGGEGKAMKVKESATKINENHKEPQVPLRYSHRGGEGKPIKINANQ